MQSRKFTGSFPERWLIILVTLGVGWAVAFAGAAATSAQTRGAEGDVSVVQAQVEPTPPVREENGQSTNEASHGNLLEQIAALGMLLVVAVAAIMHRRSLRRRERSSKTSRGDTEG